MLPEKSRTEGAEEQSDDCGDGYNDGDDVYVDDAGFSDLLGKGVCVRVGFLENEHQLLADVWESLLMR